MNPPHTCPESHLPSWQFGYAAAIGGEGPGGAGRETLRTTGSTAPEGARPLSGGGQDGGEWRWGRRGRGPPTGCGASLLPGGGPALGSVPSVPPGQRGLLGRRVHSFCSGPTSPGVRVPAPLPPHRPASPVFPLCFNWPPSRCPRPGSRARPGTPPFPGCKPRPLPVPGEGGPVICPSPGPAPGLRPPALPHLASQGDRLPGPPPTARAPALSPSPQRATFWR